MAGVGKYSKDHFISIPLPWAGNLPLGQAPQRLGLTLNTSRHTQFLWGTYSSALPSSE